MKDQGPKVGLLTMIARNKTMGKYLRDGTLKT